MPYPVSFLKENLEKILVSYLNLISYLVIRNYPPPHYLKSFRTKDQ